MVALLKKRLERTSEQLGELLVDIENIIGFVLENTDFARMNDQIKTLQQQVNALQKRQADMENSMWRGDN